MNVQEIVDTESKDSHKKSYLRGSSLTYKIRLDQMISKVPFNSILDNGIKYQLPFLL